MHDFAFALVFFLGVASIVTFGIFAVVKVSGMMLVYFYETYFTVKKQIEGIKSSYSKGVAHG